MNFKHYLTGMLKRIIEDNIAESEFLNSIVQEAKIENEDLLKSYLQYNKAPHYRW